MKSNIEFKIESSQKIGQDKNNSAHLEIECCHVNDEEGDEKKTRTALNNKAKTCHTQKVLNVNPLPSSHYRQDKF